MNDKELLEMAAKAAGLCFTWRPYGGYISVDGSIPWNPLTNDADALRLAVTLKLDIFTGQGDTNITCVSIPQEYDAESVSERHNNDPYTTTRRAIVRAAAEIGRRIECPN